MGVVSTAAFVDDFTIGDYSGPVLFIGGGDAKVYALAAATTGSTPGGAVLWSYATGKPPTTFVWSSPAFYDGSVYIGTASDCDRPLIQGQLLQIDASTGELRHDLDVVPDGCVGGSIWSSPSIDLLGIENGGKPTVYVSTGNHGDECDEPLTEASVAVDASNVSHVLGHWRIPEDESGKDTDFGATPTIQDFSDGGTDYHYVGMINKNGIFYEFRRGDLDDGPLWQRQISASHNNSNSAAFDGTTLYTAAEAATVDGTRCDATVNAMNPLDGSLEWRHCIDGRPGGGIMATGSVIALAGGHFVNVLDKSDGAPLFAYKDEAAIVWGLATIANGSLYVGDFDGNVFAFNLP